MRRTDPMETWNTVAEFKRLLSPEQRAKFDAQARAELDQLQQFLDHPPKRLNFGDVRLGLLVQPYGLPRDQVAHAFHERRQVG